MGPRGPNNGGGPSLGGGAPGLMRGGIPSGLGPVVEKNNNDRVRKIKEFQSFYRSSKTILFLPGGGMMPFGLGSGIRLGICPNIGLFIGGGIIGPPNQGGGGGPGRILSPPGGPRGPNIGGGPLFNGLILLLLYYLNKSSLIIVCHY